nr:ORF19 [Human gammaherpesvirus 8]
MLTSERSYLRYPKNRRWTEAGRFWAPHPENVLFIHKPTMEETRRVALGLRSQLVRNRERKTKAHLLSLELDRLVQVHDSRARVINADIDAVKQMIGNMTWSDNIDMPQSRSHEPPLVTSPPQASHRNFTVAIVPGDPHFSVDRDLRGELMPTLYMNQNQWLPSFGPWFISLTDNAMQRRVFPKELKGTVNFQNSTSLKLISHTLTTVASTTADFFADARHLTDTQAALCLVNAYFCQKTSRQLPATPDDLLADLPQKLDLLITQLKQESGPGDFSFTYSNPQERASLAPLNKESRYPTAFFQRHKLHAMMAKAGLFPHNKGTGAPGTAPAMDFVFAITSAMFGSDIPPFSAYQWNLRAGIVALEVFILAYGLLEFGQVARGHPNRRLNLVSLLGPKFQPGALPDPNAPMLKRGQLFSFISEHYIIPTLQANPNAPVSFIFPGIILAALEARSTVSHKQPGPFVNLTGSRFNEIFEILNQQLTFRDPLALLQARTALRLATEEGLDVLLSHPSPPTLLQEIIKSQFGGGDDYDRAYFMVLGCLPVVLAVV